MLPPDDFIADPLLPLFGICFEELCTLLLIKELWIQFLAALLELKEHHLCQQVIMQIFQPKMLKLSSLLLFQVGLIDPIRKLDVGFLFCWRWLTL